LNLDELGRAFEELNRKLDDHAIKSARHHRDLRRAVTSLQTLVVGHYVDVGRAIRTLERRLERAEDRLQIPHAIEPEEPPRALPGPT
jgi:hypothetical protein